MTISRRGTIASVIAAAAAGLPGLRADPAWAAEGQAVVGTWGGDYAELLRQNIDVPLVQPQGIEVLQDVASADPRKTKMLAERQARRGTFDVSCLSDTDMFMMAQQNTLDTLDLDRLPRSGKIVKGLRKPYAVPHIYSTLALLYNSDKISAPPKGFADMWNPEYKGRVGLSDILYSTNTFAAAMAGGGAFDNYAPAKGKLLELRQLDAKVYPSNEALAAALKSEEVWLTPMWLARGYMWQKAGIRLRHVVPNEAAYAIVFEAAVPRNARNKDAAYAYLDAMLQPSAQVAFADRMGYLPTMTDAPLDPAIASKISLSEADQDRLRSPDYDYLLRANNDILDFWNKDFKG